MKSPQIENSSGTLVEIFTGSGNGPDDARESADTRYHSWRVLERRDGREVKEISKDYSYRQPSPVYCRCILKVTYSVDGVQAAGKKN
jgi:hypothetical protein